MPSNRISLTAAVRMPHLLSTEGTCATSRRVTCASIATGVWQTNSAIGQGYVSRCLWPMQPWVSVTRQDRSHPYWPILPLEHLFFPGSWNVLGRRLIGRLVHCFCSPLSAHHGIEVGHAFHLGTKYSEVFQCRFKARDGSDTIAEMGCYGLGLTRILQAIVCAAELSPLVANHRCCPLPLSVLKKIIVRKSYAAMHSSDDR
jgi:hypothetical protein